MSLVRSRQCIVWSLGRSRRMTSYDEMALTIAGKEFEKICSHAEEPHLSENWLTQQGKIMKNVIYITFFILALTP